MAKRAHTFPPFTDGGNLHKTEEGWKRFRAVTDNGKRKRPLRAFRDYRPGSIVRPVR